MICFCGDSYVQDYKKLDINTLKPSPLPLQWHRLLAEKLYGNNYDSFYLNYAEGGSSIEHLIEQQLIKKVLPLYPSNPIDYLIVGITYNERFFVNENLSWYPGMPIDKDCKEMFDEVIKFILKYDNDFMKRRATILNSLFQHFDKFGTKIYVFNVDSSRPLYVDKKFYFQKKSIINYIDDVDNGSKIDNHYSNHMLIKYNELLGESLYNEIVKKIKK